MKQNSTLNETLGRLASAASFAAVGRTTAGIAALVNPPSVNVYNEKSPQEVILPSAGFLAMPKQSLNSIAPVPVVRQDRWVGVFILRGKDNIFSDIVYIVFFIMQALLGVAVDKSFSLFVVSDFYQKTKKLSKKMKVKQSTHLQSLAENANEYISAVCLELVKHNSEKALAMLEGRIEALRQFRKSQPAKNQKRIDTYISDMKKIAKALKPATPRKSNSSGYHEVPTCYRGHMAF